MKKVLALAMLLAGCTTAKYNPKTGAIQYKNGIFQKQFDKVKIKTPEGGELEIIGYKSEATSLVEAAARGVATGLNPSTIK